MPSPVRHLSFLPGYGIGLLWLGEVVTCYCGQYRHVSLLLLPTPFTLASQKTNELPFLHLLFIFPLSLPCPSSSGPERVSLGQVAVFHCERISFQEREFSLSERQTLKAEESL